MVISTLGNTNSEATAMFRWDVEKAIDLACIEDITVPEIAAILGTSVSSVEKFYNRNRAMLFAARNESAVSEDTCTKVLCGWGDGLSNSANAIACGVSSATVRRLILRAEYDERAADTGAADELAALQGVHPGRLYEDDVRALTEYSSGHVAPQLTLCADAMASFADAPYRVVQERAPSVTLARAA